jgi:hypothetical protein
MSSQEGSKRAIIAAFLANLGIALSKFLVFLLTGAASLLAEAIHSTADTGNQGLLMLGAKQARKPADDEHPFGYANRRYFWSFIVALVLFSLGGLFAIFEGIEKLRTADSRTRPRGRAARVRIGLEGWSSAGYIEEDLNNHVPFIRRSSHPRYRYCSKTLALIGLVIALPASHAFHRQPLMRPAARIGVLLVVIAIFPATEMASRHRRPDARRHREDPRDRVMHASFASSTCVRSTSGRRHRRGSVRTA